MSNDIQAIQDKLLESIGRSRYEHSIGVMHTAACLAMRYAYPLEKALYAGLLHDCAKYVPNDKMVQMCQMHNIPISDAELAENSLLHAKAGAILAFEEYGIVDEEILHAIQIHTTGVPDMGMLDKIIFVADYIEPSRDKAPNLTAIRELAFKDIDKAIAQIAHDTLSYLRTRQCTCDPLTEDTYLFYKEK